MIIILVCDTALGLDDGMQDDYDDNNDAWT